MANPVVRIRQGLVKGALGEDVQNHKFYKFLGIPFAKAPVGELRFADPIPADPWEGVRDCLEPGESCFQKSLLQAVEGSEDCLNLNVFTRQLPKQNNAELKPVMVWIHGGAFVWGSNNPTIYGAEYLMTQDIVLVSINYRLGFLGFLRIKNSDKENIGGNMALKDQLEALKWVKNNIAYFNGDPNNVTIFGESAGSASVHYHVLSPKSRGLFHKAIIQSGAALNDWNDPEVPFDDHCAQDVAKLAGYDVTSETEALEVLRKAPVEKILDAASAFAKQTRTGVCGPCVEKPSENAFLTKNPIDLLHSGEYNKVPLIFGYNEMEGTVFLTPFFEKNILKLENKVPYAADAVTQKRIVEKLSKQYYKGGERTDVADIDMLTDSEFVFGILTSVEKHLKTSNCPVFLYKMTLETSLNFFKKMAQLEQYKGTSHGDDLGYLFKTFLNPEIKPGSIEEKSMYRFVKMWANFAKFGNPTPESKEFNITWKPVDKKQLNTLIIDEELKIEVNPEKQRMEVWKEIYKKHPNAAWSKTWSDGCFLTK